MKKKHIALAFLVSFCPSFFLYGQKIYLRGEHESIVLHQKNVIARSFSASEPDSTLLVVDEIFAKADSNQMPLTIGEAYISHGLANMARGRWVEAEVSFDRAIPYFRKGGDSLAVANALDLLGYALLDQGYLDRQLELQLKALEYRQRYNAPRHRLGRSYGSIGNVYLELGELDKALENFELSLEIKNELSGIRPQNIGFSLRNIGRVYAGKQQYEEAIYYYDQALERFAVDGNQHFLMNTYRLLGQLYYDQSDYVKAEKEFDKALEIAQNIDNIGSQGWIYLDLAYLSEHEGNRLLAIKRLRKAEALFLESNTRLGLKKVYEMLARLTENLGDLQSAIRYSKLLVSVKDSLISEDSNKKLAEYRTRYDLQQKEYLIDLLQEKQQRDRSLRILLFLGLVLAVLAILFVYFANRRRKKAYDELKKEKEKTDTLYSNLKETQTQLIQAEKMASLGQLTAGVAHEINNPVNFITASISALKMDVEDLGELIDLVLKLQSEPDQQIHLTAILECAQRLDLTYIKSELAELIKSIEIGAHRTQDIISALHLYSRTGDREYQLSNLHEAIRSALLILKNKISDKVLIHEDFGDIPKMYCQPGKMSQVFVNLLDNAIHAVGEEGEIVITSYYDTSRSTICLSFKDSGNGMSDEAQKNAFNPFFTTKEVGQGTGLGLYISYGIVEQHGGSIQINSEIGKGTEMLIELPVKESAAL